MEEISLIFPDKLEYLHLATSLSREVCKIIKGPNMDKDFTNDVELIVSEACTNAIKHTKNDGLAKNIAISFQIYQDRLVINVKDSGSGFDIEKVPNPDFERPSESGYGIYIIKSKADKVQYTRENDCNILSMIKYFETAK